MMSAFTFRMGGIIQKPATCTSFSSRVLPVDKSLLFVQVIEPRKLPAGSRLLEVINHDLVSCGVGTRHTETLRVFSIHVDLCFAEAGRRVSLLIEDLSIAPAKLGLGLYRRNPV